ncbi:unnamed protein product [Urochloa decumbens]|uniref:KIB1-4 beta-propeller domain-containing protein n=1 Tax=Urochloa decumbens TaxID=240449 RepID=A0ABC9AR97_9POAL
MPPAVSAALTWHDLPFDLLQDISGRLHAAADYVRFHAVCKPWRDSLPPAERRPAFLPWLLAPPDPNTGHRTARCVLSGNSSIAAEIADRGRTWVIRAEDGVAYWLEPRGVLVDPLTRCRAATVPPFPDDIADGAGAIYCDGTILINAFYPPFLDSNGFMRTTSNVTLLRPETSGAAALKRHLCTRDKESCVAYHNGNIISCQDRSFERIVLSKQPQWWQYFELPQDQLGEEERFQSSYLVESRGELILACLQIKDSYCKSSDYYDADVTGLAKALSVSVYVLRDEARGISPHWVRRDGRSFLADRVLFLGRPSSFALEAARLGKNHGGCAYFIHTRDRCLLLKYSFHDGRSELVEEQPAEWTCKAATWITPQPAIALPHQL